jgi:hypothetical protein
MSYTAKTGAGDYGAMTTKSSPYLGKALGGIYTSPGGLYQGVDQKKPYDGRKCWNCGVPI